MANPFLRRATEYVRDDASFLAIVSPAPLLNFLVKGKHKDEIFELPVRIIGEPGSGKTMLAKLAEYRMVDAIANDLSSSTNRDLAGALAQAGFLQNGVPRIAAVREPMESDYRDFWELPYDAAVRTRLAFWFAQARTTLSLIRNLTANKRRSLQDIRFVTREASEAQVEAIGGLSSEGIRERAIEVQRAIYSVVAGLRPPKIEDLPSAAISPYNPFEVLSGIEIAWRGTSISLNPLVMFDDVHSLHPEQRDELFKSLARREIRFGRWLMMRLDALSPGAVLSPAGTHETHNLSTGRDYIEIRMQGTDRNTERRRFRGMALDMANRYLPLVQTLKNRGVTDFSALLPTEAGMLSPARIKELATTVQQDQKRLQITEPRRREIEKLVDEHLATASAYDRSEELRLAMTRILMHRYVNRTQTPTRFLFEEFDPDPKTPLKVNAGVVDGARLYLHHNYRRPLHFGVEELCSASNENAETFLQLAGALVARMETRAIRNQTPVLTAAMQEAALTDQARAIMNGWAFAYAASVRKMVDVIAKECLETSLSPNARLGAGANAIGIPEQDMTQLLSEEGDLAVLLKHALANGAISVVRDYGQGGKLWSLIELSGIVCLARGLTFKRGGFLEKRLSYLQELST
jgi:hypothetical protein